MTTETTESRDTVRIRLESVACPLCDSQGSKTYRTGQDYRYQVAGTFTLVRCSACRHIYMNPRPDAESLALCYPQSYAPHGEPQATADSSPQESDRSADTGVTDHSSERRPWYLSAGVRGIPGLRRLYYWLAESHAQAIPDRDDRSRTALELGCAHGDFLQQLNDRGWSVVGVEPAGEAAERARRRGFDVFTGTLESTPFEDARFDAVFSWMVVEHLPDPCPTLNRIHQLLKPDGHFLFSVPNAGCWEPVVFRRYWDAYDLPRHLQHFTPRTIRRTLERCGFDRIQIIHQHNCLNLVSSAGIVLERMLPRFGLGRRLIRFSDQPTMWRQLMLAPLAKFLALIRQSGRLTVIARRANDSESRSPS